MSGRTRITGTRPAVIWLLVVIGVALVAGLGIGGLVLYPQYQARQMAQATIQQVEIQYQAGVAFQNVGDWDKAAREYEKVIVVKPDYEDVQTRLAACRRNHSETGFLLRYAHKVLKRVLD